MVTRGYILQRFVTASAGRGNSPIKFNGSIFTVDAYLDGQDLSRITEIGEVLTGFRIRASLTGHC